MQFMALNGILHSEVSSEEAAAFSVKSKAWLQLYLTVYQSKHVTPYMHALVAHLHEFLQITQQGLEKLNDVFTQQYFQSTNHREYDALQYR